MTRFEAITQHLLAKGAQPALLLVTDKFTEHIFYRLMPSVRVRNYTKSGMIEILFVREMCAGGKDDDFHKMPEMDWVLKTIDEHVKPQPAGDSVTSTLHWPAERKTQ
jgi:hypothetical protein